MVDEESGGLSARHSDAQHVFRSAGYSEDSPVTTLALEFVSLAERHDNLDEDALHRLFGILSTVYGGGAVPRALWEPSHLTQTEIEERVWLPWLSGAFGLGSTCRVRGDSVEGTCVGIRSGRVIIEFSSGEQAVLAPSSVEGRVDPR